MKTENELHDRNGMSMKTQFLNNSEFFVVFNPKPIPIPDELSSGTKKYCDIIVNGCLTH
jgi:hypothetical protein